MVYDAPLFVTDSFYLFVGLFYYGYIGVTVIEGELQILGVVAGDLSDFSGSAARLPRYGCFTFCTLGVGSVTL